MGLLDALLRGEGRGGLLGGLPASRLYPPAAPDAASERNTAVPPIDHAVPGANPWSNGALALIGAQPDSASSASMPAAPGMKGAPEADDDAPNGMNPVSAPAAQSGASFTTRRMKRGHHR